MNFTNNLEIFQKELKYVGYESVNEPFDISSLKKEYSVIDCEIIAKKDFYSVLYMEVQSNWRGIATDVAKKNKDPCLVITKYKDSHIILSTMINHATNHAKPRYVVLNMNSNTYSMNDFINLIKIDSSDTIIEINEKVQSAFDKFSEYKEAFDAFSNNLEKIIKNTKIMIEKAIFGNKNYDVKAKKMLKMCKEVINDKMDMTDIKSMLIQHILTYRIFTMVYNEYDFHHTNTIAKSLESLKKTLNIHHNLINYDTIELIAESIIDIDERQDFLKKIYETFYQKYDPDKAKNDGIVYTPTEVVNFMVASTDQLLKKHFQKSISDDNVTILDPATGTGTFPVHILRQINKDKLNSKYTKEIYANEISILPYYIAALNIEHTHKELTGRYKEFENVCWMDTLDMGIKDYEKLTSWFEGDDNVKRISRQQKSKIHVIIGNPPYNAFQGSHNTNSDKYAHVDKKIKEDYLSGSASKQLKGYDMYKRFLKWSSNRINKHGMVVFVSNNSFLDMGSDDIFRKAVYDEFDYIYVINLKGNMRNHQTWRQEGGQLFGQQAQVGIAISFFVKTSENHSEIQYAEIDDYVDRKEKLEWLRTNTISTLKFKKIIPDMNSVWLNQTNNDFDELVPILPKEYNESIFKTATLGVTTNKDEWVYDFDKFDLIKKMKHYISTYNDTLNDDIECHRIKNIKNLADGIKWSQTTIKGLKGKRHVTYSNDNIKTTLYRPFVIKYQYYDDVITHDMRNFCNVFKNSQKNLLITLQNPKERALFKILGTDKIVDAECFDNTQNIPLWQYDENNKKHTNITEYGMDLFRKHYKDKKITDENIFYYVYGIFNDPKYEEKYEHNLKRNLPRIPLVVNFDKYLEIGKKLFELHCNFNYAKEYKLKRIDKKIKRNKTRLLFKIDKNNIKIVVDDITTLEDIPAEVLEYTFGPRNPLKWILDSYRERKNQISKKHGSNDENTRKEFTMYKFNDHKEEMISLLNRVTTVCVDTVKLRKELKTLEWGSQPKLCFTKISKKHKTKIKSRKKKNELKKKKSTYKKYNYTKLDN